MDVFTIVSLLVAVVILLLILLSVFVIVTSTTYACWSEADSEKEYIDGEVSYKFPSIDEKATVALSVVVPAYNEEERLPIMLDECLEYLDSIEGTKSPLTSKPFTYEVLVVSDGSKDGTCNVVAKYTAKWGSEKVRCLNLATNRGKGGAVRMGVLRARGSAILFADADGATKFEDYKHLQSSLQTLCEGVTDVSESQAVVCGSRAHLQQESLAERSVFRSFLMFGFHALVWLFTVRSVADTQCGFKLLTRRSARIIFKSLHLHGWAFDVELLCIAERLSIPISEVAVRWTEIDGSKVTPIWSWLQMGRDLILIWFRYMIGAWKIRSDVK